METLHYLPTTASLENRLKTTLSNTEGRDESRLFSCLLALIRTGVQYKPCSPFCAEKHLTVNLLPLLQGSNCEHNYDDCLVNPCPEGFFCVDGINNVSCLPPAFLETTVRNISHGVATRDPVAVAELSAGILYLSEMLKKTGPT